MASGEIRILMGEFAHHLSEYLDKIRHGDLSKITLIRYNKEIAVVIPACSGSIVAGER